MDKVKVTDTNVIEQILNSLPTATNEKKGLLSSDNKIMGGLFLNAASTHSIHPNDYYLYTREGIMIGMLTLISFSIGNKYYSLEIGRTMAFITIGMLELIHSFNIKSDKSILEVGIMENKYLIGSFLLGVFVQNIVAIIPTFADIFELHTLNSTQWIITIIISFMPIPIMELQKLANKDKIIKRNIHNLNYKKGETI